MDLHALRLFQAVLEQGSFVRAAAACHLTQSAVSQAVHRLERELGTPLLLRRRPPEPTPAGRRVRALADDLLLREAAARRDLEEIRQGRAAVLRLGASQALSREVLPELVAALVARHPRATLDLHTLPSRALPLAVADGRLELGLGPWQKHMPGFARAPLGRQRMVLFAGRGTAALRALRRGPDALRELALVTSSLDPPGARPGGGRLRERFRAVWVIESLDLRRRLVQDGLAVGWLPEASFELRGDARPRSGPRTRSGARPAGLVPVDWLDLGVIERQVGFLWLEAHPLSDLAREIVALGRPPRARA